MGTIIRNKDFVNIVKSSPNNGLEYLQNQSVFKARENQIEQNRKNSLQKYKTWKQAQEDEKKTGSSSLGIGESLKLGLKSGVSGALSSGFYTNHALDSLLRLTLGDEKTDKVYNFLDSVDNKVSDSLSNITTKTNGLIDLLTPGDSKTYKGSQPTKTIQSYVNVLGDPNRTENQIARDQKVQSEVQTKLASTPSKIDDTIANVTGTTIQMVPDMLLMAYLTIATGGTGTAAGAAGAAAKQAGKFSLKKGVEQIAKLGTKGVAKTIGKTAGKKMLSLVKNPVFWSSALKEYSYDFYNAEQEGASQTQAQLSAITSGLISGAIEVSGGIEKLFGKTNSEYAQRFFKKKITDTVADVLKSSLQEGAEEVSQDLVTSTMSKLFYDTSKEVFSLKNQDAIINPAQMLETFAIAGLSSILLNSATSASYSSGRVISDVAMATKEGKKNRDSEADILAVGLNSDKSSEAYKNAVKLSQKEKLSNYDIGKQHLLNLLNYDVNDNVSNYAVDSSNIREINPDTSDNVSIDNNYTLTSDRTQDNTANINTTNNVPISGDYSITLDRTNNIPKTENNTNDLSEAIDTVDNNLTSRNSETTDSSIEAPTNEVIDDMISNEDSYPVNDTINNNVVDNVNESTPLPDSNTKEITTSNKNKSSDLNTSTNDLSNNRNIETNKINPPHGGLSFTKVGEFYETYGENAKWLSDTAGFELSSKKVNGKKTPVVGITRKALLNLANDYNFDLVEKNNNTWNGVILKPKNSKTNEQLTNDLISYQAQDPIHDKTESSIETPKQSTKTPAETPNQSTKAPAETPKQSTKTPAETPNQSTKAPAETPKQSTKTPAETPNQSTKAPAETPKQSTKTPAETPNQSTKAPAETPKQSTKTPAETPNQSTKAPAETPKQSTKTPAETPKRSTKAPAETPKQSTKTPAETPKRSTKAPAETPKQSTKVPAETPNQSTKAPAETPKQSAKAPAETPKQSTKASTEEPKQSTKNNKNLSKVNIKGDNKNDGSRNEVLGEESAGYDTGDESGEVQSTSKRREIESSDNSSSESGKSRISENDGVGNDKQTAKRQNPTGNIDNKLRERNTGERDSGGDTNVSSELKEKETSETDSIKESKQKKEKKNTRSYKLSNDIDDISPNFNTNVEIINLLKELEDSGKEPTKAQKDILSKYKGWGGIARAFNEYSITYDTLKKILTPDELKAAKASVLDSYYTPTKLIDTIYKGVRRLGFVGGNVLEPSMGVGNFFGRMPASFLEKSNLFGVERDKITGRIASMLYPDANIKIAAFQDAAYRDSSFDLIIGNVPFSETTYKYKNNKYTLHDYFIIKSLDKARDGGLVALLTSTGTMDKANQSARHAIMDKANIVAAYRLPGGVFEKNAGTGVATDLLILQKRGKNEEATGESILELGSILGVPINGYFERHPENIIGDVGKGYNQYGKEVLTIVDNGNYLNTLSKLMSKLPKDLLKGKSSLKPVDIEIKPDEKPHFAISNDNRVVFIDGTNETPEEITGKPAQRVKSYVKLRDAYNELIDSYMNGISNEDAAELRKNLNSLYDEFKKDYGAISSTSNYILRNDNDYIRVTGLEIYDPKSKSYNKSEIFEKDTFRKKEIKHADSSLDALAISINETGSVDIPRIEELTGKSFDIVADELSDNIIKTPDGDYELIDVYLSGNIRQKLKKVEGKKEFAKNEKLLKSVLPVEKKASDITPQFGAPWISPNYISQFLKETFKLYSLPNVYYNKITGSWEVDKKAWGDRVLLYNKYGNNRKSALELAELALNYKTAQISDKVDGKYILNRKETKDAQDKQRQIKEAFSSWIFKDKSRRDDLVEKYNELFNSNRNMDYSALSKYLTFPGLSDTFKLRDYQKAAVARVVFGGNTLLAHGVGTGKTAEMIASAMELKRMGLVNKNLMIVPKHKISDFRSDILKMYPTSKVLMAAPKDFTPKNRAKLFSKIVSNDWDIIVIGHQSFTSIPVKPQTKAEFIENEIAKIEEVIKNSKTEKDLQSARFIKRLEKTKQSREEDLKEMLSMEKDDGVYFEEMGIDSLFVDEAHNFKKLKFYTTFNLPGIGGGSGAKRSNDLYMKINYLRSINGRTTFATATPITNTISEMYTMLNYLRPDILEDSGVDSFDAWAKSFGSIEKKAEVSPDGRKTRIKERFSKYTNVPELIGMFRQMTDVLRTQDVIKNLPKVKRVDVISPSSEIHRKYLDQIEERISHIQGYGQGRDNMLNITNDGRAMAIDLRLVAPQLDGYDVADLDLPESRINKAVENIVSEYKKSNKNKGTQFVFLDLGVKENPEGRYNYNLYDDIINKLVDNGIPLNEIAKIGDYETIPKKEELFAKVNNGEVRVLLGSTAKMGEGMNAQQKAVALHHLNCPYRPSDIEQREGRIVRFGNENKEVTIYRYIQEESFDSYMWQAQARKAEFINQAMSSGDVVELQETDEFVLTAKEGMALASGNPLLLEKVNVDEEVNNLRLAQRNFFDSMYELQEQKEKLPIRIEEKNKQLKLLEEDVKTVNSNTTESFKISLGLKGKEKEFTERNDAIEQLEKIISKAPRNKNVTIGHFRGLELQFRNSIENGNIFVLKGAGEYSVLAGSSLAGNITRINNKINQLNTDLQNTKALIKQFESELKTINEEITDTFPRQKELDDALKKQADIIEQLGMNEEDYSDVYEDLNDKFKTEEELEEEEREKELNDSSDDSYYLSYLDNEEAAKQLKKQWSSTDSSIKKNNTSDNASNKSSNSNQNIKNNSKNKSKEKPEKIGDIVKYLSDSFHLPISSGNMKVRALGVYSQIPVTVRTKITNDLPVITHELGHALDNKYELSKLKSVKELREYFYKKNPDFLSSYDESAIPGELVAEYIREVYRNKSNAVKNMPKFSEEFIKTLSLEDRIAVNKTANITNKYFSSAFRERAKSAVITRKEASKQNSGTLKQRTSTKAKKAYTSLIDDYFPIKEATEYVESVTGKQLSGNKNGYMLALNSRNANAIVQYVLKRGMTNINGDLDYKHNSFIDAISDIKTDDLEDFSTYLIYKHSLSWLEPTDGSAPKRVFADESLQDVDTIKEEIQDYERSNPEFVEAANKIYDFQKSLMKTWLVDTGIMTQDLYNVLQQKYPYYVPLKRNVGRTQFAKNSFANQRLPIMRAKGSGAMILNPLESIIENTDKFIKTALRNRTMQTLADYADNIKGFGNFMEKVPPTSVKHEFNITDKVEKLRKAIEDNPEINADGMAVIDDALDSVFGNTIEVWSPIVQNSKGIVSVIRDGKTEYYQVHDKELLNSLANLTPKKLNSMLELSKKFLMPIQLTITQFNHVFGLRNPIRDYTTAFLHSKAYNNIFSYTAAYTKALKDIISNSTEYRYYQAAGGGYTSILSSNLNNVQRVLKDVKTKDYGKARKLAYSIIHHPVQTIVRFNEITETIPRLAEFTGLKKKGYDSAKAIYEANDITINFNRSGHIGRELNSLFMFSNAQMQGLDKEIRTLTSGGWNNILKYGSRYLLFNLLMTIVVETIARLTDKDDWEQLSNYQKNNSWCIAIGDGEYIKIPKSRESSILGTLFERLIDKTFGDDEAFYQFGEYLTDTIIPSYLPTDLLKGDIKGAANQLAGSTAFGGLIEAAVNEDYKGTPIRSEYLESLPNKEQINANTSRLAYEIGQLFNIPPVYVDHVINEFGIFGKINQAFKYDSSRNDYSIGLKSAFSVDSTYSTDSFNRIYELRDKYANKYRNKPTAENAAYLEKYNMASSFITQGKKCIDGMTGDEARKATQKLIDATKSKIKLSSVDKRIISSLGKKEGDFDYIRSSAPESTLKVTEDGKSYSKQLSLSDYIKYVNEYEKLLNEQRSEVVNSNEYRKANTETKVELLKDVNFTKDKKLREWRDEWKDKKVEIK